MYPHYHSRHVLKQGYCSCFYGFLTCKSSLAKSLLSLNPGPQCYRRLLWIRSKGNLVRFIDFCITAYLKAFKVQIARQSCELLLEIIDSLLDYSKLEASAVKLENIPVFLEDVFADSVELMHTLVCMFNTRQRLLAHSSPIAGKQQGY